MRTPELRTLLVLPFLRSLPLTVPMATILPLRVAKRSIVYVPLKCLLPVSSPSS